MKNILRDSRGIALAVILYIMTILLMLSGASLFFSQLDLKITSNYKLGTQALELADAGVQHALNIIPVEVDFTSLLGTTLVNSASFSSLAGFSYTVTVENDPGDSSGATKDTNGIAILKSTALGPANVRKVVKAYVRRSIPRGAIYIPGKANYINDLFNGNATANGNDTNLDNSTGPESPVPAIATTSDDTTTKITNDIDAVNKQNQFIGYGGIPSVMSTVKIGVPDLANKFISLPHVTMATAGETITNSQLGTLDTPQITVVTSTTGTVHFSGQPSCNPPGSANCSGQNFGAGVLIVQGDLVLSGGFTFAGLVIVLGNPGSNPHVNMELNSHIHGMLMLAESTQVDVAKELQMSGNSRVQYSTQAIQMVNSTWRQAVPEKLIAWKEDF